MIRSCLIEFIGTFFLVLTIGLSGGHPLAVGMILMVMVYTGGHISGAHYNPAVSLAATLNKRINWSTFIAYTFAQLLGAFCACGDVYFVLGKTFAVEPLARDLVMSALWAELLFSFALCYVVLTVTSTKRIQNPLYGVVIGATVSAGIFSVGHLSGGAFNPAVGTAPALFQSMILGTSCEFIWIYWVAPLAAAFAAALFFKYTQETSTKINHS